MKTLNISKLIYLMTSLPNLNQSTTHYRGASVKITHVSIGIEKAVWQTGKGNDPLFEENNHCLQVNLIVGHLKLLLC